MMFSGDEFYGDEITSGVIVVSDEEFNAQRDEDDYFEGVCCGCGEECGDCYCDED